MSSWAKNRKLTYAAIAVVFGIGAVGLPIFAYLYKAPTCFDSIKNGNELGIDCGGSCTRLCQSAFLAPDDRLWTRIEKIAPGLYNIGTYIINPNIEGEAKDVPYHFVVYDKDGVRISDTTGKVTLPPHRDALAFQSGIALGKAVPAKVLFEFTSGPDWHKKIDPLVNLVIDDKKYTEEVDSSSLMVSLRNTGIEPMGKMSVSVILKDIDGSVLGFSKTIVDGIPGQGRIIAPFTWPTGHEGKVISIDVLPVAE